MVLLLLLGVLIFVFDSNTQCKRLVDAHVHVHVWFLMGVGHARVPSQSYVDIHLFFLFFFYT